MQSYPDPTAVTSDSGGPFYSSGQNNNAHNSSQPPRLSNPDDLQLAAQLTRGLEPIIGNNNDQSMHDASENLNREHQQYPQDAQMRMSTGMEQAQFQSPNDEMTPRKRSKASRACDECRRKKIKCDATDESGESQCSSCKRTGTRCAFSRVPMKRGPSKGYIKELADRLNTLEGAMQAQELPQYAPMHQEGASRPGSNDFSPPPNMDTGNQRKRTFSTISNDYSPSYQPHRPAPYDPSQRHIAAPQTPYGAQQAVGPEGSSGFRTHYSPNGLAPQPVWNTAPDITRSNAPFHGEPSFQEHSVEWDENLINRVYDDILPTLPFLPFDAANLKKRLSSAAPALRSAFMEALYVTAHTLPPYQEYLNPRTAASMITAVQFDGSLRSLADNLLLLQAMLLLAIEADMHGPNRAQGPALWLGNAVGLAYTMRLHIPPQAELASEGDLDSDDNVARRCWVTLVILDNFLASSTATPGLIPGESVVILKEDQKFGELTYHLTRISMVLGQVATILVAPSDATSPTPTTTRILDSALKGQLERIRESLPNSINSVAAPVLQLTFWHAQLLINRSSPASEPKEVLEICRKAIGVIEGAPMLISPLTHHCTSLAVTSLLNLLDTDGTREEAEHVIKSFMDTRTASSAWDTAIREKVGKKLSLGGAVAASQHALTASQSLQHLADLATAGEAGRSEVIAEAKPAPASSASQQTGSGLGSSIKAGFLNFI